MIFCIIYFSCLRGFPAHWCVSTQKLIVNIFFLIQYCNQTCAKHMIGISRDCTLILKFSADFLVIHKTNWPEILWKSLKFIMNGCQVWGIRYFERKWSGKSIIMFIAIPLWLKAIKKKDILFGQNHSNITAIGYIFHI